MTAGDSDAEGVTARYRDALLDAFSQCDNFAGAEVRSELHQLILYGVGEPSPAVAALMREAPREVEVLWQQSPYTDAELGRETRRLLGVHRGRLNSGGPNSTYTGLQFTTTDPELLDSTDAAAVLGCRYPVTIQRGGPIAYA